MFLPPPPKLADNDIHVWHARLETFTREVSELRSLLAADELGRSLRLARDDDRRRFVVCRALLRKLLESYGVAPAGRIVFAYDPQQKPALDQLQAASRIEFNVAHAGDVAVVAVARGRAVGVDVEQVRPLGDADVIVRRQFAAEERVAYESLAPALRIRAFFAIWTRKEAFLKALGTGLHRPLDSFAVSVSPDEPACLLRDDGQGQGPSPWSLEDWDWPPSHRVALAAAGALNRTLRLTVEP